MSKIKEKTIYDLELHETLNPTSWVSIIKVPGGWIYQFLVPPQEGTDFGVFVPFNNEFIED